MKDQEKYNERDVEVVISSTPEEDAWFAGMESKYPAYKGDREALYKASREGYDKEHSLNKANAESYDRIYKAIERSPETARFINRLIDPKDGEEPEEAFAEFGEDLVDLLTGKIESDVYSNRKRALMERKAHEESLNMQAGEAFVEACSELGKEPEEMYKALAAKYGSGGEDVDFRASKDFYAALIRSLSYDDDILAAEARGRNARITERNKRSSMQSDGLPHSQSVGGRAGKTDDPNSLAAIAERRRRMAN